MGAPKDITAAVPALLRLHRCWCQQGQRMSLLFHRGYSGILAIFLLFMYNCFYFWIFTSCNILIIFSIQSSLKLYESQLVINSFWQREINERWMQVEKESHQDFQLLIEVGVWPETFWYNIQVLKGLVSSGMWKRTLKCSENSK